MKKIIQFEVGKTYVMHSSCDWECTWSYTVVDRTVYTITLADKDGKQQRFRIKVINNVETCKPLGSYSMNPILKADRVAQTDTATRHTLTSEQLEKLYKCLENFVADCTEEEFNQHTSEIKAVQTLIHQRIRESYRNKQ